MKNIDSVAFSGYYLRGSSIGETIYGRNIAASEILVNFLKHSTAKQLDFCYVKDGYQEQMIKRLYRKLTKQYPVGKELNLIDRIKMLEGNVKLTSDIICDCVENFREAIYLREYYSTKRPPISIIIHCASQIDAILEFLTPALFCGLKPYDTFFCSSQAVKQVLENQFKELCDKYRTLHHISIKPEFRMDIVPLGIDDDNFRVIDKSTARKTLDISQNEFVILYLGRVSAYFKGDIMPLLRVVKNLCDKNPGKNIRFVIAGSDCDAGKECSHIKRFAGVLGIEKNVTMIQNFEYNKRNIFYSCADVFVSPTDSIQETFGLTVLEAMACGVPQVVSDWDGYKETVVHGTTGFRVPTYWCQCDEDISRYPEALTNELGSERFYSHFLLGQSVAIDLNKYEQFLQQLLDSDTLRTTLSQKSVEIFRNKFTMKKVIQSYENVWDELADIRKAYTPDEIPKCDLYNLNYFNAFKHYPTRLLDENTRFFVKDTGHNMLNNQELIPWHYEEEHIFSLNIALEILTSYADKKSFFMHDIVFDSKIKGNSSLKKRAIMWLLKHGFVSIE